MALTVRKIARLGEGRYHDEHGLYLQVSKKGGRYWAFRYKRKAVEHWLGIGSWPAFSLEEARGRARKATQQLCDGIDPVGLRKAQRDAAAQEEAKHLTFKEAAQQYYDLHQHKWTSAEHRRQFAPFEGDDARRNTTVHPDLIKAMEWADTEKRRLEADERFLRQIDRCLGNLPILERSGEQRRGT